VADDERYTYVVFAFVDTPILLLLTLTVSTKVTLVAYDNNVSILLTLMVAATVMRRGKLHGMSYVLW